MKKRNYIFILFMIGSMLTPRTCLAYSKNETIYSTLNEKGEKITTTVSNHLSFVDNSVIEDETELKNILNIHGQESFVLNNNRLTWNTFDEDIYYEGDTEKNLPIKTTITYYLNEEEKDPKEILGSSGTITIRLHFENLEKQIRKVNGVNTELYTPFVTTVGTMIDSKYNKNITISNGKVVGTGKRNILVGMAAPGLYDSIHLEELKDFNDIVITFETTNFLLNTVYIVSTPKLLENADLEIFSKMDSLYNNVSLLQQNMNTLENGVLELTEGIHSLSNGSLGLMNSLKTLSTSTNTLKTGAIEIDNGLKEVLKSLNQVKKELATLDTSSLNSLEILKKQNNEAIETLIYSTKMSERDLKDAYEKNQLANYKGSDTTLLLIKNTYELISLLNTNNLALTKSSTTIKDVTKKVNTLIISLETAIKKIENGSSQLSNGISTLKLGVDKIYEGSTSLHNGVLNLQKGASTLCEGTSKFNKEGIGTLNKSAYTLKSYSDKVEALTTLSEEYNGFSSNNSNQTVFVSKVSSLKKSYRK